MGFVVFLLIVAGIIVLIVVVKKNKRNKAYEELQNSKVYEVAVKITEELEKNGFNKFGEPSMDFYYSAYGKFNGYNPERKYNVWIYFSCDWSALYYPRATFDSEKSYYRNKVYGIENDNIGMLVTIRSETEYFEEAPEPIKIAAEVIKNNGFGSCIEFKELRLQRG